MSAPQMTGTGSRSRPQARKKVNDDAAYFGPPMGNAAAKRHAADKVDGEPRVKRKRVDPIAVAAANNRRDIDADSRVSLVNMSDNSQFFAGETVLYRYLTQFDLVPPVYPSPLLANDPPPPATLDNPTRQGSRAPSPPPATPANRPRRESKDQNRRRSSRLVEEEAPTRPPILPDLDELHGVLAGIAERHFRDLPSINGREEVDTLASFMCAVEKAKGGKNKF
ncbi:hypothetical protein MSAN_00804300 [Mycena sanguinolenta]|uniref:Histone deacetylase complex subunit SAP30 Sin3 binding domain-containing protein n=1 Tax=Mycena sanguinolenta TaxID=230812 RepID=A0A8H6YYQ9_9AGAR|nr:hypothetical protein MSAN_00804300 [Mycena sanguinolenta]